MPSEDRKRKRGQLLKPIHSDESDYNKILHSIKPERLLRVKRISKRTVLQYHLRNTQFLDWCKRHGRGSSVGNERKLDTAMSIYFNYLYEDGEAYNVASYTLFGFIALKMTPSKPERDLFPLARAALSAWKSTKPGKSRVGVPPQVVYKFASFCLNHGCLVAAAAVLLQYDLYARPSEILLLRGRDLVTPVAAMSTFWGVIVGNADFGESSKTGTTDEIVLANSGHRPWANQLLGWVGRACRDQQCLLFGITLAQYEKLFRDFSACYKLDPQQFTPHTVRHSGPSYDAIHEHRTLAEIQTRGRWASLSSVQRYRKPGRLLLQASRLPNGLKQFSASTLDSVLRTIMSRPWVPSAPVATD